MSILPSRYIGFYRPWGFKMDKFVCFHTKNPNAHFDALSREYKKPEVLDVINYTDEIFNITLRPPFVIYTRFPYPCYRSIHSEILKILNYNSNDDKKKTINKINYWPIVTINNGHTILDDPDKFIIENILCVKEIN